MNESEYLSKYDINAFDSPLFSVDAALFTYHHQQLKVLLVKRSNHPEKGKWALPGGFVDMKVDNSIEDTVVRKLVAKTGVKPPYIEQLATIGNGKRDKRGWSVTTCYTALLSYQQCETQIDSVSDTKWVNINELDQLALAFDHTQIIQAGIKRLKQKALYSIVPAYALPEKFTLSELQRLHEALLGTSIQKKSFRRRIELADLLIDTGEKRADYGRPASLYKMKDSSGKYTFIRNLEG